MQMFISYNHRDEQIVDTIARRLALEFGNNNIFYDKWSIQPGESIVGQMNDGLEKFDTFFLFLSPNSINSNMVGLEWRAALNRAVNNNLKFVVVRIAECNPPVILSDMLYIDLFGDGLDSSVEKMKKVVKKENCYTPLEDIQNYVVKALIIDGSTVRFTISTTFFAEHNPQFAFACENELNEFSIDVHITEGVVFTGNQVLTFNDGRVYNAHTVTLQRALKPGFPFVATLKTDDISQLKNISVHVLINAEKRMYQSLDVEMEV